MSKKNHNLGFSLIEVIVSIVVLVILVVPILNSFVVSTRINASTQTNQNASNVASNIMEGLHSFSLSELALQFNGINNFILIPNTLMTSGGHGYEINSYDNNGIGEYERIADGTLIRVKNNTNPSWSLQQIGTQYMFSPREDKYEFIFGIEELGEGRFEYDVLITMDKETYSDTLLYGNTMNNYLFPQVYELNNSSVTLIDPIGSQIIWSDNSVEAIKISEGDMDNQALNELVAIHSSYIAYVENYNTQHEEKLPIPQKIEEYQIKNSMTKHVLIDINLLNATTLQVIGRVQYTSSYDLDGDTISEALKEIDIVLANYPYTISNYEHSIYYFYHSSDYKEKITVNNSGINSNLYIVEQEIIGSIADPTKVVDVTINNAGGKNTKVISNIETTLVPHENYFYGKDIEFHDKKKSKEHIYQIQVVVYPKDSIKNNDYSKPMVVLKSVKEE